MRAARANAERALTAAARSAVLAARAEQLATWATRRAGQQQGR
ncbi:hypothetical protein [Dactylosporangium aurantiacum]|nr:hypothetical protein [Dactylosporangium aurantiacum]MDG6107463.1 hypothetical protein [Dactylosporangium aurantiacum]